MEKDTAKKTDENAETAKSAADTVEELPQQPISDSDAQAVKGGSIVYQNVQTPAPPEIKPGFVYGAPQQKV